MSSTVSYVIGLLKQVAAMDNETIKIDSQAERSIAERLVGNYDNGVKDLMQKYLDGEPFSYTKNKAPEKNEARIVNCDADDLDKNSPLYEEYLKDAKRYTIKYNEAGNWVNANYYNKKDKLIAQEFQIKNNDGTTTETIKREDDQEYYEKTTFKADKTPYSNFSNYGGTCTYRTSDGGFVMYYKDDNELIERVTLGCNDESDMPVSYPVKGNCIYTDKEIDQASKKALKEHLGMDIIVDADLMREINEANFQREVVDAGLLEE